MGEAANVQSVWALSHGCSPTQNVTIWILKISEDRAITAELQWIVSISKVSFMQEQSSVILCHDETPEHLPGQCLHTVSGEV